MKSEELPRTGCIRRLFWDILEVHSWKRRYPSMAQDNRNENNSQNGKQTQQQNKHKNQ